MTWIIQAIGFWSIRLRSDHAGSIGLIFSILRISIDLPWPVLSPTPNALSMAVSFMWGFWLRSSRKFTQPIVRTMPQAQVCRLAAEQRRRSLAGQLLGQLAAEVGVLFVQMLPAEGIDQTGDLLEDLIGR